MNAHRFSCPPPLWGRVAALRGRVGGKPLPAERLMSEIVAELKNRFPPHPRLEDSSRPLPLRRGRGGRDGLLLEGRGLVKLKRRRCAPTSTPS